MTGVSMIRSSRTPTTQCLWFDGSIVSINQRQNIQGVTGHIQYRGWAPIFVTWKLRDINELERLAADDPRTGIPLDAEASMLFRRLTVYSYTRRIAKPPHKMKCCGPCFAYMVLNGGRVRR